MKKFVIIIFLLTTINLPVYSQYSINYGTGVDALTARLGAEGMTVIGSDLYCDNHNYGTYQGLGELGIDTGIVLSNVPVYGGKLFGSFEASAIPTLLLSSVDTTHRPDADIKAMVDGWNGSGSTGATVFNTCALTIDFIPHYDSLSFDYVYADAVFATGISWPGDMYLVMFNEDCLYEGAMIGAFLSGGSEYPESVSLTSIPGHSDIPVNAYTLFMSQYTEYDTCRVKTVWGDSDMPFTAYYRENFNSTTLETLMNYFKYGGFTTVLQPRAAVTACDTYHLKLAVASAEILPQYYFVPGAAVFLDHLHSFGTAYDSCSTLGIQDLSHLLGISISPNPFSTQLRLDIGSAYKDRILDVTLSDLTGRKLLDTKGNTAQINQDIDQLIQKLSSGMYFLAVTDRESGKQQVFKVVRE